MIPSPEIFIFFFSKETPEFDLAETIDISHVCNQKSTQVKIERISGHKSQYRSKCLYLCLNSMCMAVISTDFVEKICQTWLVLTS